MLKVWFFNGFRSGVLVYSGMAFAAKQKMVPSAINYGDIVALTSDEGGGGGGGMRGFMQAEGHRDARLWLRETTATGQPPADYDGCLFEVLPLLQYAARREELLLLAPSSRRSGAGTEAAVRRLRARAAAERAANDQTVREWSGKPVMSGHVIQLRHVRSGKLVSLSERALAPLDASCTAAELVEAGSSRCWLQVEPTSLEQELLPLVPGAPISLVSPTSRLRLRYSPSQLPDAGAAAGSTLYGVTGGGGAPPSHFGAARRYEVNASSVLGGDWCLVRYASGAAAAGAAPSARRARSAGALGGGASGAALGGGASLPMGVSFTLLDASRSHGLGVRESYLRGDGDSDGAPVEMLPLGELLGGAASGGSDGDAAAATGGSGGNGGGGSGGGGSGLSSLQGWLDEPHSGSVWQLQPASPSDGALGVRAGGACRILHLATRKYLRAVTDASAPAAKSEGGAGAAAAAASTPAADGSMGLVELRLTDAAGGDSALFYFDAPSGGASGGGGGGGGASGAVGGGGGGLLVAGQRVLLRSASGHILPASRRLSAAGGGGALLTLSAGMAGTSAADDGVALLPVPPSLAREVSRVAACRDELYSTLLARRHLPPPPSAAASALANLPPAAPQEQVMAAALAQAAAEEVLAGADDADGAVTGVDALGTGPAASLGRLLHALTATPVPSADEAAELDDLSASAAAAAAAAAGGGGGGGGGGFAAYRPGAVSTPLGAASALVRAMPPTPGTAAGGGGGAADVDVGAAAIDRLLAWEGKPPPRRQRLLRELGGLPLVMRLIHEVPSRLTPPTHLRGCSAEAAGAAEAGPAVRQRAAPGARRATGRAAAPPAPSARSRGASRRLATPSSPSAAAATARARRWWARGCR